MTKINRFSLALVLNLFLFVLTVPAQTPSIEVTSDPDNVEFSAQGATRRVHVEVYAPSGELVFETNDSDGQSIRWAMVNQKGERVSDGVYLATITVVDSLGKKRKRIEQVTVSSPQSAAAYAPAPQDTLAPTGAGTAGKIAKWTTATNLGNSVITEGAGGRVGLNVAPAATLQVNGVQPAPLATNGTNAPTLLQTSGGKGGNTTGTSGQSAGAGASISLVAGQGGDAPLGSAPGKGGSIILQPGSGGVAEGAGAKSGDVLLAPSGVGNVGIGTSVPASKLHIVSASTIPPRLQSTGTTSFGAGWDFYHGAVGKGYVGVPGTGVGEPGPGELILYGGTGVKTSLWAGAARSITILTNGTVGIGTDSTNAKLHVNGGNSIAVYGVSSSSYGVRGTSSSSYGVYGESTSGVGVLGYSNGGYAGYFTGKAKVTGLLEVGSCTGCSPPSDRNLKANISSINPRLILNKLAALPIQTWNYKSEPESVRHIGAMAQDFRSAFGLGANDHTLNTVDAQGVTMASVQALYQMMLEKDEEIKQLRAQLLQQQAQLNQVRRTIRRKRAAKR